LLASRNDRLQLPSRHHENVLRAVVYGCLRDAIATQRLVHKSQVRSDEISKASLRADGHTKPFDTSILPRASNHRHRAPSNVE